jgi:hypothetical protein
MCAEKNRCASNSPSCSARKRLTVAPRPATSWRLANPRPGQQREYCQRRGCDDAEVYDGRNAQDADHQPYCARQVQLQVPNCAEVRDQPPQRTSQSGPVAVAGGGASHTGDHATRRPAPPGSDCITFAEPTPASAAERGVKLCSCGERVDAWRWSLDRCAGQSVQAQDFRSVWNRPNRCLTVVQPFVRPRRRRSHCGTASSLHRARIRDRLCFGSVLPRSCDRRGFRRPPAAPWAPPDAGESTSPNSRAATCQPTTHLLWMSSMTHRS